MIQLKFNLNKEINELREEAQGLKFNLNKEINELREKAQAQFNQLEKNKRLIEDQNKELSLLNNKKR